MDGYAMETAIEMLQDMCPIFEYHGLFTADELLSISNALPGIYVINTLNAADVQPGHVGHWVIALVYSTFDNYFKRECVFFDPLAKDPHDLNVNIDTFIASHFSNYVRCKYQIQSSTSVGCGYFCLAFCYWTIAQNLSLSEIMLKFSKTDYFKNEVLVRKLCYEAFYLR